MVNKKLFTKLEAEGFRVKAFKVEHLEEASAIIPQLMSKGAINDEFYQNNLSSFNYDYKGVLENAKSVVVIAAPQGKSIAEFKLAGRTIEAVIPPTYVYPAISSKLTSIFNEVLTGNGYQYARPILPLKLLAVRSGLGQYGRNNICYVEGLGSFLRLAAIVTDCEFEEDSWGEARFMDSCSSCVACVEKCPTGAIKEDSSVIHAHKCITNYNEYETPIPEWIKSDWHNSIIGCMKCQKPCPKNMNLIEIIDETISFDEQETKLILERSKLDTLPEITRGKIYNAGMEPYYNFLPRNLELLFDIA